MPLHANLPLNQYDGYRVLPGEVVARESAATLTPELLFSRYISRRRPCIIEGLPQDLQALNKWSNSYLREFAGDKEVEVELRSNAAGLFGQGETTKMQYSALLAHLEQGSQLHYMTTQTLATDGEGRPAVTSPPVSQLHARGDLPLRPALLGGLVPMCLNLWQGNAKEGASSGLHHDYHDNLYVLLRGKKQFRLYSPADAERMYTVGTLQRVHPNGRINYDGFPTRADGADEEAVAAAAADESRRAAEAEVEAAEAAVIRGEAGAAQRLAKAEAALDDALESVLMAEMNDDEEEEDDYDEAEAERPGKRQRQDSEEKVADSGGAEKDPRQTPLNFSRVRDTAEAASATRERARKFPLFAGATPVFCTVSAGEMLFLPAGWFHEVTSQSVDAEAERCGHLALNFWAHPPETTEFSRPYSGDFWPKDWARREAEAASSD